jgi:hypothetical protein
MIKMGKKAKEMIRMYFKEKRMYIALNQLDCRFRSCDECYFVGRCIVGGSYFEVKEITKEIKEIVPEYFL